MSEVEKTLTPEEAAFVARLNGAIDKAGGPKAVAEREDVALKTIYNWKSGTNASAAVVLARIARACGKSVDWLLGALDQAESGTIFPDMAEVVDVPILDVTAGAGWAFDNGHPEVTGHLPFPLQVLRRLGIRPEKVRGLHSKGDSMLPTIGDAQLVLIDTGVVELQDGRIYAVTVPDGLRLKRIQRQFDGGVVLISDNKELYEPERIPSHDASRIRVVGRAFWTERLL
jgi:phage repressor protein C with HTH and peptisase S24 domain